MAVLPKEDRFSIADLSQKLSMLTIPTLLFFYILSIGVFVFIMGFLKFRPQIQSAFTLLIIFACVVIMFTVLQMVERGVFSGNIFAIYSSWRFALLIIVFTYLLYYSATHLSGLTPYFQIGGNATGFQLPDWFIRPFGQ